MRGPVCACVRACENGGRDMPAMHACMRVHAQSATVRDCATAVRAETRWSDMLSCARSAADAAAKACHECTPTGCLSQPPARARAHCANARKRTQNTRARCRSPFRPAALRSIRAHTMKAFMQYMHNCGHHRQAALILRMHDRARWPISKIARERQSRWKQ